LDRWPFFIMHCRGMHHARMLLVSIIADLAGDGFFFSIVQQNRKKEWVRRLFVPYIVFFALSCLVSGFSMIVKMQIIRQKYRSRHAAVAPADAAVATQVVVEAAPNARTPRSRRVTNLAKILANTAAKLKVADLETQVREPCHPRLARFSIMAGRSARAALEAHRKGGMKSSSAFRRNVAYCICSIGRNLSLVP
jgi:hypothetical protein